MHLLGRMGTQKQAKSKLKKEIAGGYQKKKVEAEQQMVVVMSDDNHLLNEVLFTTQKKRQSVIDVPAAVSAVTGSGLSRLNLYQMDDMSTMMPKKITSGRNFYEVCFALKYFIDSVVDDIAFVSAA